MGKGRKYSKAKQAMPLLLLAVGIAFVCLVGGLVAKYVTSVSRGDNQIGADDFYFTLDLLEAGEGEDENRIMERKVELYGAGQNSLTFTVQNFFDGLRISGAQIDYTVSWTGNITLKQGDRAVGNGQSYALSGGSQATQAFTAAFADTAEDAQAVITVASTAPYSKEITLTVDFCPEAYDVLYRVEDSAGSAYANLIVMVGKEDGVAARELVFDWSAAGDDLQIDSTNTYILMGDGGDGSLTFTPDPEGYEAYQMPNYQGVGESGSISVLFFKTDMSKDYSKANTEAEWNGQAYKILIGPEN